MPKNHPLPPKKSSRASLLVTGLLLLATTPLLRAQWQPAATGTYSYNDTNHWAGGIINGQFSNPITGAQTVTFLANTNLPGGTLNFENLSAGGMTWQSDTAGVTRTLSLGSDVTTFQVKLGTLTLGTGTHPLTVDLGSNTTILAPLSSAELVVNAKLTGGAVDKYLSIGNSSAARGTVTLSNDTSDFVSNMRIQRVTSLKVTSVADQGKASAIGAGSIIRFQHTASTAKFEYIGSGGSTDRTVELASSAPVEIWNSGTGKLTFSGDFTRTGSEDTSLIFRGSADIEVSGSIGDSLGAGKLGVTKLGRRTLILSGENGFSGSMIIAEGTVLAKHDQAFGTGAVDLRADANLAIHRGVELQVSSLKAVANAHFTFDLGMGADAGTLLIDGDLTGGGAFTIDLTAASGLVDGTYTLLSVAGATPGDASFSIGQGLDHYTLDLLWMDKTLSLTVTSIPEPSTSLLLLGAAAMTTLLIRSRRR